MKIRFAAETDASQILGIYTPVVTSTPISFEETPPSPVEMAGRIRRTLDHYPWLVCDEDEGLSGYAYAVAFRQRMAYQWSVEVSAYVHTRGQRRGLATGLYTTLFEILRIQGYINAFAGDRAPERSERGASRVPRVHGGRRLREGGLQAGRVARRGVVATPPRQPGQPSTPSSPLGGGSQIGEGRPSYEPG